MNYFPDEVLEHVFDFVTSHRERNAVSLVCKLWYRVERFSRERVFIGNCYAISPEKVILRFPRLKSLTLKGEPHFEDFDFGPNDCGRYVQPWIDALANSGIGLEGLRLKRMLISDESLELVSRSFANFESLVLVGCEGFTSRGLEAIAANCRFLKELELQEIEIYGLSGHWLSCFPESCTSLTSLNFACLIGKINLVALESLVARSPNLKSLRLNSAVPPEMLSKILMLAPQLVDLGTESWDGLPYATDNETFEKLKTAFQNCKSIRILSGKLGSNSFSFVFPICFNLTSLNLRCTSWFFGPHLREIILLCTKLKCLWIWDCVEDYDLEVVASTCKELEELRVFPRKPLGTPCPGITERGLVAISRGCPKLHSLLYFCGQMTNAGLETVAKNCPNFIHFSLCILGNKKPDPVTKQPLDEGFRAILTSCKRLRRLSLSGLLTDQICLYIGMYAKQLERLSIAVPGDTEKGMLNVLNGCKKLRKLEIRGSPFSDVVLLNLGKYETIRSLWMSSCEATVTGSKILVKKMPSLDVEMEMILERVGPEDRLKVEKMYLYRSLIAGRRLKTVHKRLGRRAWINIRGLLGASNDAPEAV